MGEEAAPEFEKEFGGRVQDEQLQSYVLAVGGKVAGVSDREMPYEFTLLRSEVPNAFALPGGKIFITAGLMRRMSNERQLAAVLAHETAHVAAKHNVMGLQRQMGAAVLVEIAGRVVGGDKAEAAQAAAKIVAGIGSLHYSREDEYQADEIGIRYMELARYNPWGMVELLTVLKNLSDSEPGTLGEMLQTHPLSSKRIEEAENIIRSNEEYSLYSPEGSDPARQRFGSMHRRLPLPVGKGQ